jgi:hypothetical protein
MGTEAKSFHAMNQLEFPWKLVMEKKRDPDVWCRRRENAPSVDAMDAALLACHFDKLQVFLLPLKPRLLTDIYSSAEQTVAVEEEEEEERRRKK